MATDPPLTDREVSMALTIELSERRRTHMYRMLTGNRQLLADALDAVRAGDNHVADEFIDRFLTHVDAEIAYQRTR